MKNTIRLVGALHIHSTMSHDGSLSLPELQHFFRSRRYDFISITEHSYDLSPDSALELESECERLSSDDFLMIPGIEFRGHSDIDIMGFGVTQLCDHDDPGNIIDHIHTCGGTAVWAHPTHKNYPVDEVWVKKLDGAEIWNMIYDSRYAPRNSSVKYFFELKKINPRLKAFCGIDMHNERNYGSISTIVSVAKYDRSEIISALKNGEYENKGRFININSGADLSSGNLVYLNLLNRLIEGARKTRDIFIND